MKDQMPLTVVLKKVDGKLVIDGMGNQFRYDQFLENIGEGEKCEVTYEPIHGDASYAQLSKLHKCIRIIANENGDDFDSIKEEVKKRAGLYTKIEHLKSFGGLSKEEVSSAIQAVIQLGNELNINLE